MDIYKSNIADNAYSIPINLGPSINTRQDDFGFIIKDHNEGLLGYFSSNREGGKGNDDLYGFLVDEKPGFKTFALKGKTLNALNNTGIPEVVIKAYNAKNELLQEVSSDEEGNYTLEVPWQENIKIVTEKSRFSSFTMLFDEEQMKQLEKQSFNLPISFYDDLVEKREGQMVVKLKKFYFGKGQTTITPSIANELNKVAEVVKLFPEIQLRIETYTDSRGGSSTNFKLTQRRSDNIKKYLLNQGVSSSNILYATGYGEQKILNNCTNGVYCIDYLHKENQRSLFVVLNDNILFD